MESDNPVPSDGGNRPPVSILSAVTQVFTSPAELFSAPFHKFAWAVPLVLVILIAMGMGQFTRPIIIKDLGPNMRANIEQLKDRVSAEQYAEMIESIEKSIKDEEEAKIKFYYPLIGLAAIFAAWALIALLGMISGNFIFAGKERFWAILNIVAFVALIGTLGDMVRSLLILSKGSFYVYTGLGIIKPMDDGSFLYYFLLQVDAFTIWRIVVTCIGFGALYKMKAAKFAYVIVPVWLIFISLVAAANLFTGGSIIY